MMRNVPEEEGVGGVGHSEGPLERESRDRALQLSQGQTSTE